MGKKGKKEEKQAYRVMHNPGGFLKVLAIGRLYFDVSISGTATEIPSPRPISLSRGTEAGKEVERERAFRHFR
jgi:hypothetical protein